MKGTDLDDDAEHDESETPEQELLENARKRFKRTQEAESKQRQREQDDLRFQVPSLQWDEDAKRSRLGMAVAGVPVPPRPILSISKLDQPINLITNQQRAAKLGVQIHPISPDADDETAEVLQGLYRAIERDSNAGQARNWAFDRAVKCGRGWYRIGTTYDENTEDPFDQRITIDRILDQSAVYMDPSATKADFSDAEFAFITAWVPMERFKAQYPDAKLANADRLEFLDSVQEAPEWVRGTADEQAVLVCEYFYKVHSQEEVKAGKNTRLQDRVEVRWAKLTGVEVLEEGMWNGHYIPLIPVLGRELQPFDDERRWTGVIGPNKDAQRVFNYAASNAIELVALEPRAPFIGVEGQFENHESEWQQSNTRNFPYLEYKPVSVGGQPAPPPQRAQVDQGRLGPTMALLQMGDSFMQAGTATYDASLGRTNPHEKSGRAIAALQQQSEAGSSDFLGSMADISMNYEARVVLDLIPAIYDRPGRIAMILDEEDETSTVALNAPFVMPPQGRMPMVLAPGQAPPMVQGKPPKVKHYDLSRGRYAVAVSIGRSRQTQLEEASSEIGQILQAQPQLMPLIGPLYFRYRDFPGAQEVAELLGKMRDKQFPGLSSDEQTGPTPEQAQAQIQGLQQQLQQAQQQLQMAIQEIKTDQAKQQAQLQKSQMDNESRERIAAEDNRTKALIAEMQARFDAMTALLKAQGDDHTHQREMAHEVGLVHEQATADMAKAEQAAKLNPMLNPMSPAPASAQGMPLAADTGEV